MASFSIDAILGNSEPKHEDSRQVSQDLLYATREDVSGRKGIYLNLQSHFIVHKES